MAYEIIKTKRAVRTFSEQPVNQEIIHKIANAGRLAQSSKNDQPWTFIIIQEKSTLEELSTCGPFAKHIAGATFAIAIVSQPDYKFDLGQAAAYFQLVAWELGIGSCIASIYDPTKAKKLLQVPEKYELRYALSFGYPKNTTVRSARKGGRRPFTDVVKSEHW